MKKLLLLLPLLLLGALQGRAQWPTIPIVQSNAGSANVSSGTCTFNNNVTSGDILLVGIGWESTNNTPTVSDTRTSTWTQNVFNTAGTVKVAVYSATLGSGGADTVTVAITSAGFMNITCVELPPNWTTTVDASAVSTFSGTPATVTTPSITTTLNSDLIFAYTGNDNSVGWQSIQAASFGTWWQVGASSGADSQAGLIRVGGVAGAGNTVTLDSGGTLGSLVSVAYQSKPLAITSATAAPDGSITTSYDFTVLAAGGAGSYTWSVSSGALPTGLSINSSTGRITGSPTASNNYTATIQVTDGTHTATKAMTFKIATSMNGIVFLQGKSIAGTSPASLAFTSNVTSGSLLLVQYEYTPFTGSIDYCTDTLNTPFKLIAATEMTNPGGSTSTDQVLIAAGIAPSGGADTVTCNGQTQTISAIAEFSGPNFVAGDNVRGDKGSTASPATVTSGTLTTLVPNELIFGGCASFTNGSTMTVDAPFTVVGTNTVITATGERTSTTVGGYTFSCDEAANTSGKWLMALAAFRPSGGTVTPSVRQIQQAQLCSGGFGTTATCTWFSPITAGDAMVIAFYTRNGTTGSITLGLSDNNSNAFVKAVQIIDQEATANWYLQSLWYVCNIVATPNAQPTMTATNTDTSSIWAMEAYEYSGLANPGCFDAASSGISLSGSSIVPWGAAPVTPTWSSDFVVGWTLANISGGISPAVVSPFSFLGNFTTFDIYEKNTVSGTSTVTPQFKCNSACTFNRSTEVTMALVTNVATPASHAIPMVVKNTRKLPLFAFALPVVWRRQRGWWGE